MSSDLLDTATINDIGVYELPAVHIQKDEMGNIIHSAPVDSRMDASEERNSGALNESFTCNNYIHDMRNYDHGCNLYVDNTPIPQKPFLNNPNNIHAVYKDKNILQESDFWTRGPHTRDGSESGYSKYNARGDMNWGIHWPYPCDGFNGCRYPRPSSGNAIFVNYTKGITVVFGPADGTQRLATYASPGDVYVVVPPTNSWLVDKNLNYFSGLTPPDSFDSLILKFPYDNTLHKNILEQRNDTLLIPSIDMLDGLQVVDFPPTSAMSNMSPPYVRSQDPLDGSGSSAYYLPENVVCRCPDGCKCGHHRGICPRCNPNNKSDTSDKENMSSGDEAGLSLGIIFLILIVIVVAIFGYNAYQNKKSSPTMIYGRKFPRLQSERESKPIGCYLPSWLRPPSWSCN